MEAVNNRSNRAGGAREQQEKHNWMDQGGC